MPAAKSRYAFPLASYRRQPSPLTNTMFSARAYVCRTYLRAAVPQHSALYGAAGCGGGDVTSCYQAGPWPGNWGDGGL